MSALRVGSIAVLLAALAAAGSAPASAATVKLGIDYDLDGSPTPTPPALNQLDLYRPAGAGDRRPIVVYIHGGGWRRGDKSQAIADKADLFTGAGYLFASVNYRLSPDPVDPAYPPDRVRFPDHPDDVGEAIGWLDRNAATYGGDPARMILVGHSAGAQIIALLASDPAHIHRWGVDRHQIVAAVPLDGNYDVTRRATTAPPAKRALLYNAFATPAENAIDDAWARASPVNSADPDDPPMLAVTQAGQPIRVFDSSALVEALGGAPSEVLAVPYDHAGINKVVGSVADPAGETDAIMAFIGGALRAAKPPRTTITADPGKRIELRRRQRRARVRFRFEANREAKGFECRLDDGKFRRCSSPKRYRVRRGRHRFRVRAIAANRDRGPVEAFRFRVVGHRR
jgi:acetyl esterase/lipase